MVFPELFGVDTLRTKRLVNLLPLVVFGPSAIILFEQPTLPALLDHHFYV